MTNSSAALSSGELPDHVPVNCGTLHGVLFHHHLENGRSLCITVGKSKDFISPCEFEHRGGKAATRNWKKSNSNPLEISYRTVYRLLQVNVVVVLCRLVCCHLACRHQWPVWLLEAPLRVLLPLAAPLLLRISIYIPLHLLSVFIVILPPFK